jgi:hypothetical protein
MRTACNVEAKAEKLVRRIVTEGFHQKIDAETVRNVACKVSQAIPRCHTPPKLRTARS